MQSYYFILANVFQRSKNLQICRLGGQARWTVLGGQCWVDSAGWTMLGGQCWVDGQAGWTVLGGQCWVDRQAGWTVLGGQCWVDRLSVCVICRSSDLP